MLPNNTYQRHFHKTECRCLLHCASDSPECMTHREREAVVRDFGGQAAARVDVQRLPQEGCQLQIDCTDSVSWPPFSTPPGPRKYEIGSAVLLACLHLKVCKRNNVQMPIA